MWNQGVQQPDDLASGTATEAKEAINEHEALSSTEITGLQPDTWLQQEQPCQQLTSINAALVCFGREDKSKCPECLHGPSDNQQFHFKNFLARQLETLDEQENIDYSAEFRYSTDMMAECMPNPLPETLFSSVHANPNKDALELEFSPEQPKQLEQLFTQSEQQTHSSNIYNAPRHGGQVTAAMVQLNNEQRSKQMAPQIALTSKIVNQEHVNQRKLWQQVSDQQIFDYAQSSVPTHPQHLHQLLSVSQPRSYPQHLIHNGQRQQIAPTSKLADQSNSERYKSVETSFSSNYMITPQISEVAASFFKSLSSSAAEKTRAAQTPPQHGQWPPWVFSHPTCTDIQPLPSPLRKRKAVPGKNSLWKDADRPKRPLTAYNIFFQHERVRMLGEKRNLKTSKYDNLETTEILGGGGDEVECEKKKIIEKDRLLSDTSNDDVVTDVKQLSTVVNKRDYKALLTNKVGFQEMARYIGCKWKNIDEDTKARYQLLADKDKDRYHHEKKAYLQRKEERDREGSPESGNS